MANKIKASDVRRSSRKQTEIEGQLGRMKAKKILPVAFLVMWMLAMALVWWVALAPGRWETDTITYTRMSIIQVNLGRGGPKDVDVLIAADCRHFSMTEAAREALAGKLQSGEECRIVYARNPIGMGPEQLKSLSTDEDGELVSIEKSLAQIAKERKNLWWLIGVPVLLFLIVEIMIDVFGCKKERIRIAQLKAEQAKFTAREERKRIYVESKRAGG